MLKFDITRTFRDENGDHMHTLRGVSLVKARAVERKHRRRVAGKIVKRGPTNEPCKPNNLQGWTTNVRAPGARDTPINFYPGNWGFDMNDGIPFGVNGRATITAAH